MTRSRPCSYTWRIAGARTGSLFFSYLTDKYGRKRLFLITLGVYLVFSFLLDRDDPW